MDELPLEIIYKVAKLLSVIDYFCLRGCNSKTLRMRQTVEVGWDEYKQLAEKHRNLIATSHKISLQSEHLNDDSFCYLAKNGHKFESVRILESRHAENIPFESKKTAYLILARYSSPPEMVVCLLRDGHVSDCKVEWCESWIGLHAACANNGTLRDVETILTMHHLDVSKRTITLRLPQHYAAIRGRTDVIKLLHADGRFDLGAFDDKKETTLHPEVRGNHLELTSWLLTIPAIDPKAADVNGNSVWHLAALQS
jgi:hypothetical protein